MNLLSQPTLLTHFFNPPSQPIPSHHPHSPPLSPQMLITSAQGHREGTVVTLTRPTRGEGHTVNRDHEGYVYDDIYDVFNSICKCLYCLEIFYIA